MNYRGFSQAELEAEYSPSTMIGGDPTPYLNAYAALGAQARARFEVRERLEYGPHPEHVLDFFPAQRPDAPLHVFIHGGYWQALSHRDGAGMAPALIGAGQAFATLNYRLAPGARLAEMVAECRDALIWLARNAERLGFDPSRVTLSGHSAGAHLAAMVLSDNPAVLADAGLVVTDAILISGIYDLEPISRMSVNAPLQLTEAEIETLSPLNALPPPSTRFRITVAGRDTPEFIRQSRSYAEHLRKAGISVAFDLQPGRHHFDIVMYGDSFRAAA